MSESVIEKRNSPDNRRSAGQYAGFEGVAKMPVDILLFYEWGSLSDMTFK